MKRLLLAVMLSACLIPGARAAWWAENDYATGSNGLKKDSLTLFTNAAPSLVTGFNAAFCCQKQQLYWTVISSGVSMATARILRERI